MQWYWGNIRNNFDTSGQVMITMMTTVPKTTTLKTTTTTKTTTNTRTKMAKNNKECRKICDN